MTMRGKPDIDAFLEKGESEGKRLSRRTVAVNFVEPRKQVVMHLPLSVVNAIKKRAFDMSMETGRRVTQQELVEDVLREAFLDKK